MMATMRTMLVVAGLDERDMATVDSAAWFAGPCRTRSVSVIHVANSWEPPAYWPPDEELASLDDDHDLELRLSRLVTTAEKKFARATPVESSLCHGSTVREVARVAHERSADIVCVGIAPGEKYDRLTEAAPGIVRKAPCSVMVVPAGASASIARVLVPIDFSERALETLRLASDLRGKFPETKIICQHVYSVPLGYHKTGRSHEEWEATMRKQAEEHAQAWLAEAKLSPNDFEWRFDLADRVPDAILKAADETDADMILMAGHGRTVPSGMLLGHAADSICRRTRRRLLVVKKKGEVVHLLQALGELFELRG